MAAKNVRLELGRYPGVIELDGQAVKGVVNVRVDSPPPAVGLTKVTLEMLAVQWGGSIDGTADYRVRIGTADGRGPTLRAAVEDVLRQLPPDPITEDSLGCCDESTSPMDADGVPTVT